MTTSVLQHQDYRNTLSCSASAGAAPSSLVVGMAGAGVAQAQAQVVTPTVVSSVPSAYAGRCKIIDDRWMVFPNKLGAGARSVVFEAHDLLHSRPAAIKVTNCTESTLRESAILQKINELSASSPVSVRLCKSLKTQGQQQQQQQQTKNQFFLQHYQSIQFHDKLYIITEKVSGIELFKFCQKYPNGVPEPIAKFIFRQILQAVAMVHEMEIAHLDLKLENIMIDPASLKIKIIDFGFSSETQEFDVASQQFVPKLQRTRCGSTHYAAPEIISQAPYDAKKADVWSLGIVLFALLTGRFPFDDSDDSQSAIFQSILHLPISFPDHLNERLCSLLDSFLCRSPADRPSCLDLLDHPWFD